MPRKRNGASLTATYQILSMKHCQMNYPCDYISFSHPQPNECTWKQRVNDMDKNYALFETKKLESINRNYDAWYTEEAILYFDTKHGNINEVIIINSKLR